MIHLREARAAWAGGQPVSGMWIGGEKVWSRPAAAPVMPVFSVQPSLTGSLTLGSTITVSLGAATGTPTPALTGILTRPDKTPAAVADGDTFQIEAADQGGTVTLEATATNSVGTAKQLAAIVVPGATIADFYGTGPGNILVDWRLDEPVVGGTNYVNSVRNDGGGGATYAMTGPSSKPTGGPGYVDFTTATPQLYITTALDLQGKHFLIPVYLRTPSGVAQFPRVLSHSSGEQTLQLNLQADEVLARWSSSVFTGNQPHIIPKRQWYLLEVRVEGGRVTFYRNGEVVNSITGMPTTALLFNRMGKAGLTTHWLNGLIGRSVAVVAQTGDHLNVEPAVKAARQQIATRYGISLVGPAWAAPADWSSTDPHWDNVTTFADYRRTLGLDQSEAALSIDYVPENIPAFDSNGAVFDGSNGYVTTYSDALGMGDVDATVELFGVVPSGEVARVVTSAGAIQWAVRHDGTAWVVTVNNGGTPTDHSITDAVPTEPVDLALVRSGGTLRFFRGGALLYTGSAGSWAAGSHRLVVAGAVAPFSALQIAGVRITRGVARYSAAYAPAYPDTTAAKMAGGGLRVSYGSAANFNAPYIQPEGDKLLLGSTTKQAIVADHDFITRKSRMKPIHTWSLRDQHNAPVFLKLPDGRVMIVASGHETDGLIKGYTDATGDIMTLTAAPFTIAGVDRTTYANLFQLEGEPGAPIYLVSRTDWAGAMARTYDNGATWEYPGKMFDMGSDRPYLKLYKTSPTRIDFFNTYSHPETTNPGLFHCYYEGGVIYNSFGVQIGTFANPPVNVAAATRVFDGTVTQENSWQFHIDRIGNALYGIASVSNILGGNPTGTDKPDGPGYYIRCKFDLTTGGPWQVERIHSAGGTTGSDYGYPGACLDLDNPDRAFVSVNIPGRIYQLIEVVRAEAGDWRAIRQITQGGKHIRPKAIVTQHGKFLTWLDGDYLGNLDYRSSLRLLKI